MACTNRECEDGWLNVRNLTAPPRPCLDCNPEAAARADKAAADLREIARWRDAPPREVISDFSSRLQAAQLTLEAVRLALASVFGKGHETRDHVELAADVVRTVAELTADRDHWKRLAALLEAELDRRAAGIERLTTQLAESEERRVTARRESDAALERLHAVTAQRDAAVKALARYEADGNLPSFCPCCGGESLCDGCEDGCALRAAREACGAGLSHA